MSDHHNPALGQQPPASPDAFLASWEQKERAYRERASAVLDGNKKALFGILAEHGITAVIVNFDGYGDSGQIEDIAAQSGDVAAELPDERIELFRPAWDSPDIERQTHTVREAIEALSYDFLAQTHCGWWSRDKALYLVARASFLIPLAEPDVRVSLHPALYVRLTPQVDLIIG